VTRPQLLRAPGSGLRAPEVRIHKNEKVKIRQKAKVHIKCKSKTRANDKGKANVEEVVSYWGKNTVAFSMENPRR
jgi:hypothetical protein